MPRALREISDHRPGLQPPKFTLRTLLGIIALIGILITIGKWMAPMGLFLAVIAVLSVAAHMASTAIGGQLRANGAVHAGERTPRHEARADSEQPRLFQPTQAEAADFAPPTKLRYHQPLVRKPIYLGIGVGVGLGAIIGATALTMATWENATTVNVLFGTICAAGLGGLFGFWASSLFQVVRDALAQAQKDES